MLSITNEYVRNVLLDENEGLEDDRADLRNAVE